VTKINKKTDRKNDEFTPRILKLKEKTYERPSLGGVMMRWDERCSLNGPPPCPPAPKCQK